MSCQTNIHFIDNDAQQASTGINFIRTRKTTNTLTVFVFKFSVSLKLTSVLVVGAVTRCSRPPRYTQQRKIHSFISLKQLIKSTRYTDWTTNAVRVLFFISVIVPVLLAFARALRCLSTRCYLRMPHSIFTHDPILASPTHGLRCDTKL